MRLTSAEERRRLVGEYEKSGMSQAEFCTKHELSAQTFGGWLKQKKRSSFVPVELKSERTRSTELEVRFVDGTVVRVSGRV